ncbi:hypothetical protein SAMN05216404_1174 [Nitrosospira multiformis]|uniref:Response regulatory domain-containing protein n=1 Tax=Nitrosospira multiformis TaxID=1231 RepID=A0A1H8NLU8_9PROT|nr:hypothetical protein SAMN05216404_1174 [Nitrosospira multiformis]
MTGKVSGRFVRMGCTVSTYIRVQAHQPDVIVCDLNMPQVNDYQFIKAARNLPADKGGNALPLRSLS